ncbi:arylsulfatase [Paraglaciecola sp. L3A3]|uniref:arylsulfatase n=1 Tax=Paraglaciecola sp. L3A3 TaxID=2686358 RepID=UPI00131C70B3|nr:arylsulfatase [Paraglaciecola sp. L3A3]
MMILAKPYWLLLILFVVLGCSVKDTKTSQSKQSQQKPNVIFILADDLGYGDIGAYGQQKIKTPNIDKLALEGIKFNQHYAGSPVCGPSRASLLTGMHTGHSKVRGNPRWTNSGKPVELGESDITVGDVFKSAGYNTAIIGKWAMADAKETNIEAMPSSKGFDYFFGFKTHKEAHHYYWHRLFKNNEPYILTENDFAQKKGKYTHDLFTDQALNFVDKNKDDPFFLYLAFTIPHLELTVPEDSKKPYQILDWPKRKMNTKGHYKNDEEGHTAYAGMVSRMDRDIGVLMDKLKSLGIDDNTLVIFTSDNGHEYDRLKQPFFNSNGPFRGMKRDLYEGGIRMPFIARWPNKIQQNTETNHVSAFWDFMATACDITKVDECPSSDGISYLPTLLSQDKQVKHDFLYWEFNERKGPIQAVVQDNWKLIKNSKGLELYDLSQDKAESNNLIHAQPALAVKLLTKLEGARTPHPEFTLQQLTP